MTAPRAILLGALFLAASALGQSSTEELSTPSSAPSPLQKTPPLFGIHLEAGVPDGIGASFVVTPGGFLRLEVGALNNGVGSGARVGASVVGFPTSFLRPVLGVDAGAAVGPFGDWLPQLLADSTLRDLVSGASVRFIDAQLGVEIGSPYFALTLRAGASYVDVSLADHLVPQGAETTAVTASGFTVRALIPSARVGLLLCFG